MGSRGNSREDSSGMKRVVILGMSHWSIHRPLGTPGPGVHSSIGVERPVEGRTGSREH